MAGLQLAGAAQELGETQLRGRLQSRLGDRHQAAQQLGDDLLNQRLLGREAPVDRADPDPRPAGDLVDARLETRSAENLHRRRQDALAVGRRITAQRRGGDRGRGAAHAGTLARGRGCSLPVTSSETTSTPSR